MTDSHGTNVTGIFTYILHEWLILMVNVGKYTIAPENCGWKTILSYGVLVTFQGRAVKLREGSFSLGIAVLLL